jgi:hypothetical protein
MLNSIPIVISNFLDKDIDEVKSKIKEMSLSELVELIQAIRDNNKEEAFKIYSGSSV